MPQEEAKESELAPGDPGFTGHGSGFYAEEGWEYDGHWLNGKPHGRGIVTMTNGYCWEGIFYHGRFTS